MSAFGGRTVAARILVLAAVFDLLLVAGWGGTEYGFAVAEARSEVSARVASVSQKMQIMAGNVAVLQRKVDQAASFLTSSDANTFLVGSLRDPLDVTLREAEAALSEAQARGSGLDAQFASVRDTVGSIQPWQADSVVSGIGNLAGAADGVSATASEFSTELKSVLDSASMTVEQGKARQAADALLAAKQQQSPTVSGPVPLAGPRPRNDGQAAAAGVVRSIAGDVAVIFDNPNCNVSTSVCGFVHVSFEDPDGGAVHLSPSGDLWLSALYVAAHEAVHSLETRRWAAVRSFVGTRDLNSEWVADCGAQLLGYQTSYGFACSGDVNEAAARFLVGR